jgi:hypothetical protein
LGDARSKLRFAGGNKNKSKQRYAKTRQAFGQAESRAVLRFSLNSTVAEEGENGNHGPVTPTPDKSKLLSPELLPVPSVTRSSLVIRHSFVIRQWSFVIHLATRPGKT